MFGHGGGGWTDLPRLPSAVMIICLDFAQFGLRLFVAVHSSMCAISAKHDLELAADTTRYVSSAYLKMRFAGVTGCKSAAVTTYDAGPSTEPCMTLAFISATDIESRTVIMLTKETVYPVVDVQVQVQVY